MDKKNNTGVENTGNRNSGWFNTNEPEKKYTIVLAGTYNQFLYYLDEIGATDSDYIYGDAHNIMGIRARDIVEYGTFYERKDADKLRELAQSRL